MLGSNSFSGSRFVDSCLDQDIEVWGVSRSSENVWPLSIPSRNINKNNFHFHQLDLNMDFQKISELAKKNKVKHIFNFAAQSMVAQSWSNPEDWYNTNLVGTSKLLNSLCKINSLELFLQFSTPEVYGSTNGWIKENFNFSPTTPYAISRAASDYHLKAMAQTFDFPVVFTRAANVYGPGQPLYRLIPRVFFSALTKEKMVLDGGGKSQRSFIEMNDVADALTLIAEKGQINTTYHISTTQVMPIIEIVKICSKISEIDMEEFIEFGPERVSKDEAYMLDSQKIRQDLGWQDKITIEQGLRATYEWVKDNLVELRKLPRTYQHRK